MTPYEPALIIRLLRAMSDERLSEVTWQQFQMHPAPCITKGAIIRELIANERDRRKV